jgi:hypothetical protein
MASLRMLLSAVSLSITLLLWPPTSPAGPQSCKELMNEFYEQLARSDLHDYLQKEMGKDFRTAQEYIKEKLPALKAACPTEANSIRDIENGNYLKKLAAERERRKKANRHIKGAGGYTGGAGQDEDLEGLEILR